MHIFNTLLETLLDFIYHERNEMDARIKGRKVQFTQNLLKVIILKYIEQVVCSLSLIVGFI
jgi:hypothetical protein